MLKELKSKYFMLLVEYLPIDFYPVVNLIGDPQS